MHVSVNTEDASTQVLILTGLVGKPYQADRLRFVYGGILNPLTLSVISGHWMQWVEVKCIPVISAWHR